MSQDELLDYTPAAAKPPLNLGMGIRLSVMMFLQYTVWGVWAPILNVYLAGLPDFKLADGTPDNGRIGLIYMTLPIASIIGPFIAGQIADRYFAAQRFLAVSQLLGGAILLVVARCTGFAEIFIGMLVYNLIYAPTIAISNAITFQHWPSERFSWIRVWGSIGWIVIGLVFGLLWMEKIAPRFGTPSMVDCLYFAAALSLVYGLMAFSLPHTPPSKQQGGNPLAFLEAVRMMRVPAFAVMAVVSFFVAMELQLYFALGGTFLKSLGIPESRVGPALTAGQICEMIMMVALPFVLRKIGFRLTMAIGIAAWALRDFVFSVGQPAALVLGAISLHGVGFAFFFTVIFMFTDTVAPKDIKASAQSFLASVTIGCGMLIGSLLAGPISTACGNQWSKIFLVPAVLCAVCCVALLLGFREKSEEPSGAFPVVSASDDPQKR
jgi:nucleoside transporter